LQNTVNVGNNRIQEDINMVQNKIAVVGDKDAVAGFAAVGVEVFDATTAEQAKLTLNNLCKQNYAVVFIAECLAEQIPETLAKIKVQPFPAVVPIPTNGQSSGFGMAGIKADVEKAIGVDILFNKEVNK
jgi:V/A-type H+-transporting ATPase subunit F